MSSGAIISMVVGAFIFGAIVGVLLISMCMSNERYDENQASYELGYRTGYDKGKRMAIQDFEATCSHCAYYGRLRND